MQDERLKSLLRAGDERLVAFDEVEHIDSALGVMRHRFRKPMSAGSDKLPLMQAGLFFAPSVAGSDLGDAVDQVLFDPASGAVPLGVGQAVRQMDGARLAVQAQAAPIPELEGEDVGGGADFQHHGISSRTMDGAGGDKEMVMLLGWPLVGVSARRGSGGGALRAPQVRGHRGGINPFPQAAINRRPA